MGKQIVAALVSVILAFGAMFVPMAGLFGAIAVAGSQGAADPKLMSGAFSLPIFLALGAGLVSFAGLFYLKLHYGTIALLALSSLTCAVVLFTLQPLMAALAGAAIALSLAALVCFGLWKMLKWVYAPVASDPTGEF